MLRQDQQNVNLLVYSDAVHEIMTSPLDMKGSQYNTDCFGKMGGVLFPKNKTDSSGTMTICSLFYEPSH